MKIGVVDVGGGLRGVYAAGVFDYCLDKDIRFDLGIGVSAGSANVASYLAGQKRRNFVFYTDYPFRKEYMSLKNFVRKRSYLDLDYIYGTLSNADGENPLDYRSILENPCEFVAVATDARTGEAAYFGKEALEKVYEEQGRVLILAPDDTCGVDTLTKDREVLRRFYEKGYRNAHALDEFLP